MGIKDNIISDFVVENSTDYQVYFPAQLMNKELSLEERWEWVEWWIKTICYPARNSEGFVRAFEVLDLDTNVDEITASQTYVRISVVLDYLDMLDKPRVMEILKSKESVMRPDFRKRVDAEAPSLLCPVGISSEIGLLDIGDEANKYIGDPNVKYLVYQDSFTGYMLEDVLAASFTGNIVAGPVLDISSIGRRKHIVHAANLCSASPATSSDGRLLPVDSFISDEFFVNEKLEGPEDVACVILCVTLATYYKEGGRGRKFFLNTDFEGNGLDYGLPKYLERSSFNKIPALKNMKGRGFYKTKRLVPIFLDTSLALDGSEESLDLFFSMHNSRDLIETGTYTCRGPAHCWPFVAGKAEIENRSKFSKKQENRLAALVELSAAMYSYAGIEAFNSRTEGVIDRRGSFAGASEEIIEEFKGLIQTYANPLVVAREIYRHKGEDSPFSLGDNVFSHEYLEEIKEK